MCYDAPKPPDPVKTGAAQTATNIGTAVASQFLNNVNQVTPEGNLEYSQNGTYTFTDPVSGESYDIPTFTATQTFVWNYSKPGCCMALIVKSEGRRAHPNAIHDTLGMMNVLLRKKHGAANSR